MKRKKGMSTLKVKIYFEDTDCGGVVYHANYLRYFERARTEYFAERGISIREYMEQGISFVVARADIKYKSPAIYGDTLVIETKIEELKKISITFDQKVRRHGEDSFLVQAKIKIACVNREWRLLRFPKPILENLIKG
jgi:acyl-CoA thioester hydrolase